MSTSTRNTTVGYFQAVGAATLWGSSGIFAVFLFRGGMSPESVALLRPVVGAAFLFLIAGVGRRIATPRNRHDFIFLVGVGGGLTALFQLSFQKSLDATGVPTTVALLYLAPAIVVTLGGPVLGEWPSPRRIFLSAVSVVGVWLTVLGAQGATLSLDPAGLAWGGLAALGYAGYTMFGRAASDRFPPVAVGLWSTVGACAILGAILPWMPVDLALPPDARSWAILLTFGLFTISVATILFYASLGKIEAGHAAVVTTVEPVVAALLATLILQQGLSASGWFGLTLVVAGVAGSYAAHPGDPPTHE